MPSKFVYFYSMKNEPDKIRAIAPIHHQYWVQQDLTRYNGGPFTDRSGGLVTFESDGIDQALEIVDADPFITEDLLESCLVKEWVAI